VLLDPQTGELEYVNAGHPPPLILSEGQAPRRMERTENLPLRLDEVEIVGQSMTLGTGETLVLYSDPDGGSTQNATLVRSFNTVVTNGNTGIINNYAITPAVVSNFMLVGVLAKNLPTGTTGTDPNARFLASQDQTEESKR